MAINEDQKTSTVTKGQETVAAYAARNKKPVKVLLAVLHKIGLPLKADDVFTAAHKEQLLKHLKERKAAATTQAKAVAPKAEEKPEAEAPKKPTIGIKKRNTKILGKGSSNKVEVTLRRKKVKVIQEPPKAVSVEEVVAPIQTIQQVEIPKPSAATIVPTPENVEEEAPAKKAKAKRKVEEVPEEPVERKVVKHGGLEFDLTESAPVDDKEAAKEKASHSHKGKKGKQAKIHLSSDRHHKKRRSSHSLEASTNISHGFEKPTAPVVHEVIIPELITVADLAARMHIKAAEIIRALMGMGAMVTINQMIDQETAQLVVEEMGHVAKLANANIIEDSLMESLEEQEFPLESRPPVVTIMGHVDHGKTSLLDYIRRTKVIASEAGGITQHIGAYHVDHEKGQVTFLDTPGHEAFTAMRSRGAQCTDIIILVVAADDGVMPQTIEAIKHAKAADVPMIVAVNKMDKEGADVDKIKTALSAHEVIPEDWGGDIMFVPISAKTGQGIDDLLDTILLQSEVLELKAPVEGPASGIVIESRVDVGRGTVVSLLVTKGHLKKGDVVLSGREYGRVRAMMDELGKPCVDMGPSMPVEILGLSGTPQAGDAFMVVPNERKAREVAQFRQGKYREVKLAKQQAARLENLFSQIEDGKKSVVNIVLKADVHGSCEAITDSLRALSTDEVRVAIVSAGVGGISESDITLAMASDAIVVAFNVRADSAARTLAQRENIEIRQYSVIYQLLDEVKQAMSGLLAPEEKENVIGMAEVREVFRSSQLGAIAGCLVMEGTVKRSLPIRVLRNNVVVFQGELESLRRFKDEAKEVKSGTECGIGVKNYNDIKVGDLIEVYEVTKVKRSI
jgi:translation initiation factor IF-2